MPFRNLTENYEYRPTREVAGSTLGYSLRVAGLIQNPRSNSCTIAPIQSPSEVIA
jgi:hypothetical protein